MSTDLQALAAEAYMYGFPLVFGLDHVRRRSELGPLQPAPFNMFSHARKVSGPEDRFVYINNDTIYSIAQVDVSGRPLLLTVPDTADRYYVLQFIDAWTNNFAYVGRRATGTKTGLFLLAPPGWTQDPPAGIPVIEFPTTIGTIIGRWACSGADDLDEVRMLQSELTLEPYGPRSPQFGVPEPASVPRPLAFFERMRTWMQAFPPVEEDRKYAEQFAPLGLLEPETPYRNCPPDLVTALTEGRDIAEQRVAAALRDGSFMPQRNGWALTYHLFDYNVDHFGIGTLDEPEWKLADRMLAYRTRSLAAHSDLWGIHGYEIASPTTSLDADGNQLDGRNAYTITFDTQPPTEAFWSLTMYKQPDFYLVSNPARRYSIGSRTPGLLLGSNDSLTIQIQHGAPHDTSNWLPAPAAPFRLILRGYQPAASYAPPPVVRTHLASDRPAPAPARRGTCRTFNDLPPHRRSLTPGARAARQSCGG